MNKPHEQGKMAENEMIKGSMVALVTPMLPDGAVEWDALALLVDWHIAQKTNAIVVMGTTGESATLDFEEHTQVVAFVVKQAAGRIPIIAGTGANATSEAVRLTREAAGVGVDACLLVTPYYNKPTQAGLVAHYQKIANAVNIPQILYNVPGRTACDMLPETVLKLVKHDNIVGIKEATGDLTRAKALIRAVPEDFAVYSGDDETAKEFILMGGDGNISVTANLVPHLMSKMCAYAMSGEAAAAEEVNLDLALLNKELFVEANPIPVKWAMHRMGLIDSGIRLPLTRLSDAGQKILEPILQNLKLLEITHV